MTCSSTSRTTASASGKIIPEVPESSWIKLMNKYKSEIITGTLKPPAACESSTC